VPPGEETDTKNSEVTAEAEEDGEREEVSANTGTEHLLGACDVRGVANVDPGGTEDAAIVGDGDGGDLEENDEQTPLTGMRMMVCENDESGVVGNDSEAEIEKDGDEKQEVDVDSGAEHLLGTVDVRRVANIDPGDELISLKKVYRGMSVEKTMSGKKVVNTTSHIGVSMRKVVTTFSNEGTGKNLSDYLIDIKSSTNKKEDLGEQVLLVEISPRVLTIRMKLKRT
jgi:hypothetical protein